MLSLLFFSLINVESYAVHVDNKPAIVDTAEIVLYDAHAECSMNGNVLDCVYTDKISGEVTYTVCTLEKSGPSCIDYVISHQPEP